MGTVMVYSVIAYQPLTSGPVPTMRENTYDRTESL